MTAQGLGVDPSKLGRLTEQQMIKVERQRLEASVDAFKLAYQSLIDLSPEEIADFTTRDSYETCSGYEDEIKFPIPQGAFIFAAIAVGYTIRRTYLDLYVYFDPPASLGADDI
jgi:hypothetical protein